MATQAPQPVRCAYCAERLIRTIAGNIIDYTHPNGTHQCQRVAA